MGITEAVDGAVAGAVVVVVVAGHLPQALVQALVMVEPRDDRMDNYNTLNRRTCFILQIQYKHNYNSMFL